MYYIMLKFSFLYVGLRKTIKNVFKLIRKNKIGREKAQEFHIAWPIDSLEILKNLQKISKKIWEIFPLGWQHKFL